jgi:hypothetical protein
MDRKYDIDPPYDPSRTQRLKIEVSRAADTGNRSVAIPLLQHMIENVEAGVNENRRDIQDFAAAGRTDLASHVQNCDHVREKDIRNWIAAAIMDDSLNRDKAAKGRYFLVVLKYWVPAFFTSGGAVGALIQWLTARGH